MMRPVLGAVSFLTIFKPREAAPSGASAAFFPAIGAALGAAGAAIYLAAPGMWGALGAVALWTAIAGVAMFENRRAGVAILALSFAARWWALAHLVDASVWEILIASQAVPRAAMAAMAWVSRPAAKGLALSAALTTPAALIAIGQGIAAALGCGTRLGIVMILGSYVVIRAVQWGFYKGTGGVNRDSLAVTEQALEIFILALAACGACGW